MESAAVHQETDARSGGRGEGGSVPIAADDAQAEPPRDEGTERTLTVIAELLPFLRTLAARRREQEGS